MGNCNSNKHSKENKTDKNKAPIKKDDTKNNENKTVEPNKEKEEKKEPEKKEINFRFMEQGGNELFSAKFSNYLEISSLFDIISKKVDSYSEYDILSPSGESLKAFSNDKIYTIFRTEEDVELSLLYLGLDISHNILNDYSTTSTIVGAPITDLGNKIGLIAYNSYSKEISTIFLLNSDLNQFSYLSAYCNGRNKLFISGGEKNKNIEENESDNKDEENSEYIEQENKNYLRDFYYIDLMDSNKVEKLSNLNIPRAWHSMLYIPNNYIFIVGGTSDSVEIYNIEKKSITVDSHLNEMRYECTLCCINDALLFAFFGFRYGGTYLKNIEKCNLRVATRKWEIIDYNHPDVDVSDCFYISYALSSDKIILFAQKENTNNEEQYFENLLFDAEYDIIPTLSVYNTGFYINDVCPEKFFHPLNDGTSVLFSIPTSKLKLYKLNKKFELSIEEKENSFLD